MQWSCRLTMLRPSVWYQKSEARDQSALRLRIWEIVRDRPRFGFLRVLVMLKCENWGVSLGANFRLTGRCVRKALDEAALVGGWPKEITMDNGTDFPSKALGRLGMAARRKARLPTTR